MASNLFFLYGIYTNWQRLLISLRLINTPVSSSFADSKFAFRVYLGHVVLIFTTDSPGRIGI